MTINISAYQSLETRRLCVCVCVDTYTAVNSLSLAWSSPNAHIWKYVLDKGRRYQWPGGLRRRPAADRLHRLWVRIPPIAWLFVS